MNKIIIKNLEIYGYHGVCPEEAVLGQKFFITLELFGDFSQAAKTDNLELSVNYAQVCKFVEKIFLEQKIQLIESCARKIAENILYQFPLVSGIKIVLKKPWAPIGSHVEYVAVEGNFQWHTVYLGLGSNMGNKEENLAQALSMINTTHTILQKTSSFYQTKPVGYLEQDDFINCAVEVKTILSPQELIEFVLEIEQKLKRQRTIHWGPRTIDIDVLFYDDLVTEDERIILPHPRIEQRLFVLVPLCEIAPYKWHPLLKKRVLRLKEELELVQTL